MTKVIHTMPMNRNLIRTEAFTFGLRSLSAAFVLTLAAACNPSTDRPDFGPLTGALVDTLTTPPTMAIAALSRAVDSAGLTVRRESTRDGYMETRGYDVEAGVNRNDDVYNPKRIVVLRFWADLIPGDRSRITAEASYRTTSDPSVDRRLSETMADRDHAGYDLLLQIVRSAKGRVGG